MNKYIFNWFSVSMHFNVIIHYFFRLDETNYLMLGLLYMVSIYFVTSILFTLENNGAVPLNRNVKTIVYFFALASTIVAIDNIYFLFKLYG